MPSVSANPSSPDLAFTEKLFHWMAATVPGMATQDQSALRAYLTAPQEHPIGHALAKMLATSPTMVREFEDQPFDTARLMLGPLLFWGLTQPWAAQCDVPGCLTEWSYRLRGATNKPHFTVAIMSLNVLPLLQEASLNLDGPQKERLRFSLYNTTQALTPWDDMAEHYPFGGDPIIAPLALLASSCKNQTIGDKPLDTHWRHCMRRAMKSMTVAGQIDVVASVLREKDLPARYKNDTLKCADPLVWLSPKVKPHMQALLPQEESKRYKKLPWAKNGWQAPVGQKIRPGEVNRMLYQHYCPLLYLGLEMVAPHTQDWEDRSYIEIFSEEFTKTMPRDTLALPEGLDADV